MTYSRLSFLQFIGRFLLASTFAIAVPPKIIKYQSVLNTVVERGFQPYYANLLLVAAIFLLVVGSISLILFQSSRAGPLLLLIFIIPATVIFHLMPFQSQPFFINLGLIGGLLLALSITETNNYRFKNLSLESIYIVINRYLKRLLN